MARRWRNSLGIAAAGVALLPAAGGLLYAATRVGPCDRPELTASIGDGGRRDGTAVEQRSGHGPPPRDLRSGAHRESGHFRTV